MSGLASLLAGEGFAVSGSGRTRSHKTDALAAKGIEKSTSASARKTCAART